MPTPPRMYPIQVVRTLHNGLPEQISDQPFLILSRTQKPAKKRIKGYMAHNCVHDNTKLLETQKSSTNLDHLSGQET